MLWWQARLVALLISKVTLRDIQRVVSQTWLRENLKIIEAFLLGFASFANLLFFFLFYSFPLETSEIVYEFFPFFLLLLDVVLLDLCLVHEVFYERVAIIFAYAARLL